MSSCRSWDRTTPANARRRPREPGRACWPGYWQRPPPVPRRRRVAWSAWTTGSEVREFLATRRAKITPEQAGLPAYGGTPARPGPAPRGGRACSPASASTTTRGWRRATWRGLRERARRRRPRPAARRGRARPPVRPGPRGRTRRPRAAAVAPSRAVRPSMQRILDSMTDAPAFVRNGRLDILADQPARPGPLLACLRRPAPSGEPRPLLLPRPARARTSTPTGTTRPTRPSRCCAPRPAATRTTGQLTDLVGELSTRSEDFRTRWAAHDVRLHRTGDQALPPPGRRRPRPAFDALELPAEPGPDPHRLHRRAGLARPRTRCACSPAGRPPTGTSTPRPSLQRSTNGTDPVSPTATAPRENFTGDVYVTPIFRARATSRMIVAWSGSRPAPTPTGTRTPSARPCTCTDGLGLVGEPRRHAWSICGPATPCTPRPARSTGTARRRPT